MKIIAIRIKNLASLDGITEIDFQQEPLRSAGIFAITGATGAGKSTILDALCLALYAKTPRYADAENGIDVFDVQGSTIKQDDIRAILRDGTSDGYAEVEFVGLDKTYYRATWSVRRARNKIDGNLQAYEMALYNCSTGQVIPGKKTELLEEIVRIVGLNFEQFTRSVLLAQGDFTAFLKASKDEKSSLLEKLTGTHIYSEISKQVFEKNREEQKIVSDLLAQCNGISTLSDEDKNTIEADIQKLNEEKKEKEKSIQQLELEMQWLKTLHELQQKANDAKEVAQHARQVKEDANQRKEKLDQIIRIQPAKIIRDRLYQAKDQFQQKREEQQRLNELIDQLSQQLHLANEALEQSYKALQEAKHKELTTKPLLEEAKKLDIELSSKKNVIQQLEKEVADAKTILENILKKKKNEEDEIVNSKDNIEQTKQWQKKNKDRQSIAENESLLLYKLADAEKKLSSLKIVQKDIQEAKTAIENNSLEKGRLENKKEITFQLVKQKKIALETLQTNIHLVPISALESERQSLTEDLDDCTQAAAHWKIVYSTMLKHNADKKSVDDLHIRVEEEKSKRNQTENLVIQNKVEKNNAFQLLEKAKLAIAENVEHLRMQLQTDAACPVCGSTEHPYANQQPHLNELASALENDYHQKEKKYIERQATYIRFDEMCNQLEKQLEEKSSSIESLFNEINTLETTWQTFRIVGNCNAIPAVERTSWLENYSKIQKDKQKIITQQIDAYYQQKKLIEKTKTENYDVENQLNTVTNQVKDLDRTLISLSEKMTKDEKLITQIEMELEDIKQTISSYFVKQDWYEKWKSNPEKFSKDIKTFALEWKVKKAELEKNENLLDVKKSSWNETIQQVNIRTQELEQKRELKNKHQKEWETISEKRNELLHGEKVDVVEKSIEVIMNANLNKWEDAKKIVHDKKLEIESNTGTKAQLDKDCIALEQQITDQKIAFDTWLQTFNKKYTTGLDTTTLEPLFLVTTEFIEKEQTYLRQVEDDEQIAASIEKERSEVFEKHLAKVFSNKTIEEVTSLLQNEKETLSHIQQASADNNARLQIDATNKQNVKTILQKIKKQEVIADDWAKLNEAIGSADGKKFRQIAQEYTLDILLQVANIHLDALSKRYVLQRIPFSLGLQVMDTDMGDEVRTVYSLSGGESFLVSLALALGLASLSSGKMKVESLFIDEGFGSLDPSTLNIAMDALERLHNQGRKVGVISHVQEMTERIPVQISVRKLLSGKSKVEIV